MEAPDYTKTQAEHLGDLVNNKIAPAFHYLDTLSSLSGQINALARQAGIEMLEGNHV